MSSEDDRAGLAAIADPAARVAGNDINILPTINSVPSVLHSDLRDGIPRMTRASVGDATCEHGEEGLRPHCAA